MAPWDPSRLYISISQSAISDGRIRIRPSEPMPKWRSLTNFATAERIFHSFLKTVYIYIIVSNAVHFREFHNDNLLLFLNIILGFSVGAQDPHGKNTPVFSVAVSDSIVYWIIVIEKVNFPPWNFP